MRTSTRLAPCNSPANSLSGSCEPATGCHDLKAQWYRLVSPKRPNQPIASRPSATQPDPERPAYPPHGIENASRAVPSCTRMQDICPPTDHGIAGASQQCNSPNNADHPAIAEASRQSAPQPELRHGIAEASQQSAAQTAWHELLSQPTQVTSERPRPLWYKLPTDHGIARASHLCGCPNPTRMVSPWRRQPWQPKSAWQRLFHTTNAQRPNRSGAEQSNLRAHPSRTVAPTVGNLPAITSRTQPHGFAEASHDPRQQPTCLPHGVAWSVLDGDRGHFSPSWSVRRLAAPRSVGPRCRPRKNSAHQYCRPVNFAKVSCSPVSLVADWSTALHMLTPSTHPQTLQ